MDKKVENEKTVKKDHSLHGRYSGGPMGLGDPDDKFLRKVEKDILIPKKMRDKAREEKCVPEVADFTECCKNSGFLMVVNCRKVNAALKECLTKWYNDEEFKNFCKNEYLEERAAFRRTGVPLKQREQQRLGNSM